MDENTNGLDAITIFNQKAKIKAMQQREVEQEHEIERLKENLEYANLAFQTLDREYKELEAQLRKLHKLIGSHSVYLALRLVNKSPLIDAEDDYYIDLYNISGELRKQALESSPTEQPEAQKPEEWRCNKARDCDRDVIKKGDCECYNKEQQNKPQPEKAQEEQSFRKNCYIGSKIGCHCETECHYNKLMDDIIEHTRKHHD